MGAEVKVDGFDELARKLRELVPAMRKKVVRNSLAAGARVVRDDAKRRAPVLSNAVDAPYRKAGTVRDAIRVRTSKVARKNGDIGVFVNVLPAKGSKFRNGAKVRDSQRGAQSRNDPYYWRFLEFGTKKMPARPFLKPAAQRLNDALQVFQAQIGKWFDKVNRTSRVDP